MVDLVSFYQHFLEAAKTNPILQGLVGLFGMGVVTFLLVKTPKRIWNFLVSQYTTSVSFTNDNTGYSPENFVSFMQWFNERHFSSLIRDYSLDSTYGLVRGMQLGVGNGTHLFFWKGRPCWLRRERLQQTTGYTVIYNVKITVLGRSRKPIMDMIESFKYRPTKNKLGIYKVANSGWERIADVEKRSLDTVIVDPTVLNEIVKAIEHFKNNRDWYISKGFPYKLTFLLHGVPGTGKTSLIKAIASHFDMNLCLLNLGTVSDDYLQNVLSSAPKNAIIAIEDFDSTKATWKRNVPKKRKQATVAEKLNDASPGARKVTSMTFEVTDGTVREGNSESTDRNEGPGSNNDYQFLTLSGILNALQGLLPLEDKVLFLTTNHIELMDEALVRKGRVDKILEIGALKDAEVRRYVKMMFPESEALLDDDLTAFAPVVGCDLQALYYEHRDDVGAFINAIPRVQARPRLEAVG